MNLRTIFMTDTFRGLYINSVSKNSVIYMKCGYVCMYV